MLTLPIKKKWFDMIISGEKKEEYREIKPYYDSRFEKDKLIGFHMNGEPVIGKSHNRVINVIFRNGYSKNSQSIKCKVKITKGHGKPEWGAEPGKLYYVLKILSVEEVTDVKD